MTTRILQCLAAGLLLTGCSSNSFLQQRYTNYKHHGSSQEESNTKKYAVKSSTARHADVNSATSTEQVLQEPSLAASAAIPLRNPETQPVASPGKAGSAHSQVIKPAFHHSPVTSAAKTFKPVSVKESKQSKRGLLFGIINAALSIVILIVVAFAIVFLVLLIL